MKDSIKFKVDDFMVEYCQSKYSNNVKVYVDRELQESRQNTWFMSKLLNRTLELQNSFEQLESFARENMDNDLLDEFLKRARTNTIKQ